MITIADQPAVLSNDLNIAAMTRWRSSGVRNISAHDGMGRTFEFFFPGDGAIVDAVVRTGVPFFRRAGG